jgi:transcriptional regulator with XRE-family HTH domain
MDKLTINKKQKDLLLGNGTAYSLAKKSGVAYNTVNDFLSGKTFPRMEQFRKICEGAGVTPVKFYELEE